jgi:hypothetical protein
MHEALKKLHDLPEFGHKMPRLVQLVLLPNLSAGYRPGVLNAHIKNHHHDPEILATKMNPASLVNKITHKNSGCSTYIFPA